MPPESHRSTTPAMRMPQRFCPTHTSGFRLGQHIWGVFAESNLCLDRRLRRHDEIQDQVLRLLDIMRRNLISLAEDSDAMPLETTEPLDEGSPLSQAVPLRMQGLQAISAALERLNQLGTAIRRSSMTRQTSKARELAETFDLTSFEHMAYMSLKTLYPDCSESLIEQLTRSMLQTYALFLHSKSRKPRLETNRLTARIHSPLQRLPEEPLLAYDDPSPGVMEPHAAGGHEHSNTPDAQHVHPRPRRPPHAQSEPTSFGTQEVRTRLKRMLSPSVQSKPMSILVNQTTYPRANKESLTCEWCFGPLPPDSLEGLKWQKHINEDFRPYICVSEKCSQPLVRFASSSRWFQHMVGEHGETWYREVHAPSSWICPLCTEDNASFPTPDIFAAHLHNYHGGIFKEQHVKAIVRQSRFPSSRPDSTCPLCSLPVSDGQSTETRKPVDKQDDHSGRQGYPLKPDDSVTKRRRTGYSELRPSETSLTGTALATHMTAHLQGVLLLTLRLISIEGPIAGLAGSQGPSTHTDDQRSCISSRPRDLELGRSGGSEANNDGRLDDTANSEYGPSSVDVVPDCEEVDWSDVPRIHETPAGNAAGTPIKDELAALRVPDEHEETAAQKRRRIVGKILRESPRAESMRRTVALKAPLLDGEEELLALIDQYYIRGSDLHGIVRGLENYMSAAEDYINRLEDLFVTMKQLIVPAADWSSLLPWSDMQDRIEDRGSTILHQHIEEVKSGVWRPLEELRSLYRGRPSLAIAHLRERRQNYIRFLDLKEHAQEIPPALQEQAEEYEALEVTLKHELPRLHSLCTEPIERCLGNFARIQAAWFESMQGELKVIATSGSWEEIAGRCHKAQAAVEARLSNLVICNSTILDLVLDPDSHLDATTPSNDESSSISEWQAPYSIVPFQRSPPLQIPIRPQLNHEWPPRPRHLAVSMRPSKQELDDQEVDGYPWLAYSPGEVFELFGAYGERFLAKREHPLVAGRRGWIYRAHFQGLLGGPPTWP
ncbi:hypothetical protein BJX68DRAFT_155985 [Aspergillus pseudodeflectus]|uniref:C2H2-type domain-containing protein n=1 Tax=Aspergillus pseudodeflectus TaxID=176178 RepID=A0ABR4JTZ4_9EURO